MIRKFYKKSDKWVRLQVTAPDGRFQTEDIVGGVTIKSGLFEAKRFSDKGMIVSIFSSNV